MTSATKSGCGCSCEDAQVTLVFPCAGASNVGQITNHLALRMAREGLGSASCLAGVGAHISGFVVSAKDCDQLVVIDGCSQGCAAKVFEHVSVKPHVYVTLTEHGFEKRHGEAVLSEEVDRAIQLVVAQMKGPACSTAS